MENRMLRAAVLLLFGLLVCAGVNLSGQQSIPAVAVAWASGANREKHQF